MIMELNGRDGCPYYELAVSSVKGLSFSPALGDDYDFVSHIFKCFRGAELAGVPDGMLGPLLDMQWSIHRTGWREVFPDAWIDLIRLHGEPIGYQVLDVRSRRDRIHGVEIALRPDRRGGGVAVGVLRALRKTADAMRRPAYVTHHHDNPVRRITSRLGWRVCGVNGPMVEMCYTPPLLGKGETPSR